MTSLRVLSLSLVLALALPASAQNLCGDACQGMLRDAHVLEGQGKFQEALDTYRAAEKAEPLASMPFAYEAALLFKLSARVKPDKTQEWRDAARVQAMRALKLWANDPVALETLRMLDDPPTPLHAPNPQAASLQAEAELLFAQRHYPEALQKYEAAAEADPQFSVAWVDAADCYFMQKDWPHAEYLFRRATEIEPRNAQAWRFLADALLYQGKRDEGEAALLSGIGADPSQRPTWNKLAGLRGHEGHPLKPLALRRGVRVTQGADGKYTIKLDSPDEHKTGTADLALRLALAGREVELRTQGKEKDKDKPNSPYEIELDAWRWALKVVEESAARTGQDLSEPALLQMRSFARDGQLEPAILLLSFRQSYRPALEAWEAARPGGVKAFVDRYGIAP